MSETVRKARRARQKPDPDPDEPTHEEIVQAEIEARIQMAVASIVDNAALDRQMLSRVTQCVGMLSESKIPELPVSDAVKDVYGYSLMAAMERIERIYRNDLPVHTPCKKCGE